MGLFGAVGLWSMLSLYVDSAFHEAAKHPVMHTLSLCGGAAALFFCIGAVLLYVYGLKKLSSERRAMTVILTVIVLIAAFIVGFVLIGAIDGMKEPIKAILGI